MSDQPTFAGLKKWLRDEVQPAGLTVRTVMLETVRELEALEQRVRELRDKMQKESDGITNLGARSKRHADELTAVLRDKPAMIAPITDEYRKLSMQIAELWDLCRDDKANQLLADHDAAVRRQALEEAADSRSSQARSLIPHLDLYAAYANHCAIKRKVPMTFHTWKRQGKPRTP